jgi:hypothetical protein
MKEKKHQIRSNRFVSTSEFYALLKQKGLLPPGKLLSPEVQDHYLRQLGFPPHFDS